MSPNKYFCSASTRRCFIISSTEENVTATSYLSSRLWISSRKSAFRSGSLRKNSWISSILCSWVNRCFSDLLWCSRISSSFFLRRKNCSKAVLNFSISRLRYSSGSPVYAARSSCGFSRILAVYSSRSSSISEIRLNFLYSKSFATSCVRGSSATSALPSSGTARGSSILDLISSKAAASTINSDDTLTSVICMAFTCSIYCFTISEI